MKPRWMKEELYQAYMYSYPHKTAYGAMKPIEYKDYPSLMEAGADQSLYLHVPFCSRKCGYCNLFSYVPESGEVLERYLQAMELQGAALANAFSFQASSLVIGGGTPLIFSPDQLKRMLQIAEPIFDFASGDSCIETSPKETTPEKLHILEEYSLKRLSIGVQSFVDEELTALKRSHDVASVRQSLSWIRERSFETLNLDLIYGIGGQTKDSWRYSLEQALEYEPEELFVYPLYVRFPRRLEEAPQEEKYARYQEAREFLKEKGYTQKSMRKFEKTPSTNMSTCGFESNISLGCGGRTYLGNVHGCMKYSEKPGEIKAQIQRYLENPLSPLDHGFILNEEEQKRRFLIKNLLIVKGFAKVDYVERFGNNPETDFPVLVSLLEEGYLVEKNGILRLQDIGLSDWIGPMLMSDEVARRMAEWEKMNL